MNHLLRSYAPISDDGWSQLDREVQQRLVPGLAARRLVDFSGPHGWEHSAVDLGRVADIDAPAKGLRAGAAPRAPARRAARRLHRVARSELRDLDRGAVDLDFGSRRRRRARDRGSGERRGVPRLGGGRHRRHHRRVPRTQPIVAGKKYAEYPKHVAKAVETLLSAGVSGPYGLALGPDSYTGVVETTEHGGLIVFDHLREILGGPIVWAPGVRRRGRRQPARRRLPVRVGRGSLASATTTTTPRTCTSISKRASRSASPPPKPRWYSRPGA